MVAPPLTIVTKGDQRVAWPEEALRQTQGDRSEIASLRSQ